MLPTAKLFARECYDVFTIPRAVILLLLFLRLYLIAQAEEMRP